MIKITIENITSQNHKREFIAFTEMEKVIKIAEINFWPKKICTKKWPKNDLKLPKIAQKLPKISKMAKNCQIGPKNDPKLPKWPKNDPKWPKN